MRAIGLSDNDVLGKLRHLSITRSRLRPPTTRHLDRKTRLLELCKLRPGEPPSR